MEIIEKGKDFKNILDIEKLNNIIGGNSVFCIKFKDCDQQTPRGVVSDSCGILFGCPDKHDQ